MAATTQDLEIWIEEQDEPILVRADQRDMAEFEVEYKIGVTQALDSMQVTFFRYLGWHAARRKGLIPRDKDGNLPSREKWLGTVVSVDPASDEEIPDPTTPAA